MTVYQVCSFIFGCCFVGMLVIGIIGTFFGSIALLLDAMGWK